eukprot:gene13231-14589_t
MAESGGPPTRNINMNNNVQAIVDRLVNSPEFQRSLERIVSSTNNNESVTTSSSSGSGIAEQRRQFLSSEEEQRFLFGRGRPAAIAPNAGQRSPRSIIPMRRQAGRQARQQNHLRQQPTTTKAVKPPYVLREVILLDECNITNTIRAPKKAELMSKGFVFNDVKLERDLSEEEVYLYFESLFASQIENVQWNDREKKLKLMIGIGHNLVEPRLTANETLTAAVIHRLYGTKIVWLLPAQDIGVNSRNQFEKLVCENCGNQITEENDRHFEVCIGGPSNGFPRTRQQPITAFYTSENIPDPELLQTTFDSESDVTAKRLEEIFPDACKEMLSDAIAYSCSWDEAVDSLTENCKSEMSKNLDSAEVIQKIQTTLLKPPEFTHHISVNREDFWRESMRFYKLAVADKELLYKRLTVGFNNEYGIDAGALRIEFFDKFFAFSKAELFESTPKNHLIPKRSGGNIQLFKIVGIAIGHSLLQGGPVFQCLAPWCFAMIAGKDDNYIVTEVSIEKFTDSIPLNAGSANVISFLKALDEVKQDEDIDEIFDKRAEGPAFEQIVNSTQWPLDSRITTKNLETFKSMIVWEELVQKREKQLKAIQEGLYFVGLQKYMELYYSQLYEYFVCSKIEISPDKICSIVDWEGIDHLNPEK